MGIFNDHPWLWSALHSTQPEPLISQQKRCDIAAYRVEWRYNYFTKGTIPDKSPDSLKAHRKDFIVLDPAFVLATRDNAMSFAENLADSLIMDGIKGAPAGLASPEIWAIVMLHLVLSNGDEITTWYQIAPGWKICYHNELAMNLHIEGFILSRLKYRRGPNRKALSNRTVWALIDGINHPVSLLKDGAGMCISLGARIKLLTTNEAHAAFAAQVEGAEADQI